VKARLHFLEHLAAEYGDKIAWKRVIEFAKGQKAFEHKDGGVRDAAKSVVVTLMTVSDYDCALFAHVVHGSTLHHAPGFAPTKSDSWRGDHSGVTSRL